MGVRDCALQDEAFSRLRWCYDNRTEFVQQCRAEGVKTVAQLGFGMPEEIILAAGMDTIKVYADKKKKLTLTDRYLEYSFAPTGRAQFEGLIDGTYKNLVDYLVIADSEDIVNRIYYYLREIKRSEPEIEIPELYFIDWLFSKKYMYQQWNYKAISRFKNQVEQWIGHAISDDALEKAIELCNGQHDAVQAFDKLRCGHIVRVTGTEALIVMGAGFFMSKGEHIELLKNVTESAKDWPEVTGARLFFTGTVQEDTEIYTSIEASGAVIVGEDHNWGTRHYEFKLESGIDPIGAIVNKYMLTGVSTPKGLVSQRVSQLCQRARAVGAHAVISYTEEYEDAASWDFPSQKKALGDMGIDAISFNKMKYHTEDNPTFTDDVERFMKNIVIGE